MLTLGRGQVHLAYLRAGQGAEQTLELALAPFTPDLQRKSRLGLKVYREELDRPGTAVLRFTGSASVRALRERLEVLERLLEALERQPGATPAGPGPGPDPGPPRN